MRTRWHSNKFDMKKEITRIRFKYLIMHLNTKQDSKRCILCMNNHNNTKQHTKYKKHEPYEFNLSFSLYFWKQVLLKKSFNVLLNCSFGTFFYLVENVLYQE